jgi:endoglucanase
MAERHGFYVILDMHGAPGSQNKYDHSGRANYNQLWSDEHYREQTVWLWQQIAGHYRGRKSICGYDLLNEPWGGEPEQLKDLTIRLFKAIRKEDPDHLIIFPSYYNKIDFYGIPKEQGWENIAFTCHFYPGFFGNGEPTVETHSKLLRDTIPRYAETMKRLHAPLLIGEFNVVLKKAGGGEMMRRYFDIYGSLGWAATMWSYKVLTNTGEIGGGIWGMVTNAKPLDEIDFNTASREKIQSWFSDLSVMEYAIDEDLRQWLLKKLP